ncbi:alpha/beta hydrolase [Rhodococcus sp. D2-41]|uniref:Lysophospholipase n=1 Tax=Speluncibacter jeojiensis TaxID=2710754 RepID=A0A9X4M1X2_9ACTN|nr:alpha/beta fold hydrolase [Rhodococcus sp. D2-41]MDG3012551.1 alpha/beta hydrolase [Rhodococcus sp. D2-41]MDG3015332.1 lysophospholipase [Corynebacteriales bacterium D3-21]
MPFFTGVSGQVFYRRWEVDDPSAVLVFLHGLGQHTGHYHRFAKHLRGGGVELWALDHVGHGMTEGDLGEVAALSELAENSRRLVQLARAARPGLPWALMGHSLGAATAMTAVLDDPADCAAVVLCGSPIGAARRRGAADPEAAARRTEADAELRARFAHGLEGLGVPILALHGTDDRIIPIDGVREWIGSVAGVELIEYRDAGHDLLHEKVHREVADDVLHFLRARV